MSARRVKARLQSGEHSRIRVPESRLSRASWAGCYSASPVISCDTWKGDQTDVREC
jgi:hypothetical protein